MAAPDCPERLATLVVAKAGCSVPRTRFLVLALVLTSMAIVVDVAFCCSPSAVRPRDEQTPASFIPQPAQQPAQLSARRIAHSDCYGDPLPQGASARLGTIRLRHGNGANAVFTPDGQILMSCGGDRTIRYWDPVSGRLLREQFIPPRSYTPVVLLSPDGKLLAFQDADSQDAFNIWDIARRRLRHRLPLGERWWHQALFSPDSKTLVTAQHSGIVRAWDVVTGKGRILMQGRWEVRGLGFAADGTLITVGPDEMIRLWDVARGRQRAEVPLPKDVVNATVSPDGRTLAVWCWHNEGLDHGLRFLDVRTGKPAIGWSAPPVKRVHEVKFTPDGKTVLIATANAVLVWDPLAGKLRRRLVGGVASNLTVSPDGKTVAALGAGNPDNIRGTVLHVWDLATGKPRAVNTPKYGHLGEVDAVTFAPGGTTVASACRTDGSVRLWDTATGRLRRAFSVDELSFHNLTFSPDGELVFAGTSPAIVCWDVATGREARRYRLFEKSRADRYHLMCMHLNADGTTLHALAQVLTGGPQQRYSLHTWSAATGQHRCEALDAGEIWIGYSRFSPDGRLLAFPEGSVRDTSTGKELFHVSLHGKWLDQPVAFSADGALLACGVYQDITRPGIHGREMIAVQVFEVATQLPVVQLKTGPLADIVFAPDGRQLITTGARALQRWDLASGQAVVSRPAPGHFIGSFGPSFASCLALAPDGRTVATGQPDTTVLLWDLGAPALGHPARPLSKQEQDDCWTDLASGDAHRALVALGRLEEAPAQALALMRKRLRPIQVPPPEEVRRLVAALDDKRFSHREVATRRLADMGELAGPVLRQALKQGLSLEARKRVERLLREQSRVRTPEARRGLRALRALQNIGTAEACRMLRRLAAGAPKARLAHEAKAALAALLHRTAAADDPAETKEPVAKGKTLSEWTRLLQGSDVMDRQAAVQALGKMGPAAAPALAMALGDKQVVNCRLWAAHALGNLGGKAKDTVPQLVAALKDESGAVRVEAAGSLWKIDRHKASIPALAKDLRAGDPETRYYAAEILEGIGPDAKAAVPALVKALNDAGSRRSLKPDGTIELRPISLAAAKALKRIDPEAAKKHGIE